MQNHNVNGNKIALITGGSKGLGLTIAHFLATQGVHLIITARNEEQLERSRRQLVNLGAAVDAVRGDVSSDQHRKALLDKVSAYGGLDLLIHNASTLGPLPLPPLSDYQLDDLRRVFEVNTLAPLALTQLMRPYLANRGGLVVHLSSDAAVGGYANWGGYGSSKAALDLIALTLAKELQEEGIGVVSVDPGDMRTDMQQDAFPGEDISDRPLPEITIPFWAWLFGQEIVAVSGQRFQAQEEMWEVVR